MSAHAMTATCTGSNGSNVGPLSGYLVQRPGGALARLKGRRKRWYVFDQHSCSLDSYKNDLDAASRKPPLFSIDLRNAAISFLVDEENCFVIHSGAKEYVFVAGNHESMMAWVMALQANRDLCREQEPINSVQMEEDDVVKRKISLPAGVIINESVTPRYCDENQGTAGHAVTPHQEQCDRRLSLQNWKAKAWPTAPFSFVNHARTIEDNCSSHPVTAMCETVEENTAEMRNTDSAIQPIVPLVSTSSSECVSAVPGPIQCCVQHRKDSGTVISPLRCREANGGRNHYRRAPLRRVSHHGSTSDCESDSDAVDRSGAGRDCGGFSAAMWERIRFLRMASSESTKDSNRHQERAGSVESKRSLSGNSVSSDSAIGHGDSVLSLRLHELEAELMATKCELAKALNRETSQKNTLIEQDNLIAELQHRLHCLEASGDDSRPSSRGNSMNVQRMNDKCCMLQSHNRFLNEEVQNLSRLLQQQQCHAITYQNCLQDQEKEIDQLKRDYVFLMQSAIRMRSMEGPEVMEVYFYGGQRHAARVLQLLREARMSNPGLPTYDSQSKVLQHTDALGFRHYYTEESLALHYICRQLHLHYQERLPSAAHHLWRWRQYLLLCGDNLISTKELKSLVRQGVPAAFRSQVWKALYTCRVADIIEDKGKNYYSNLCCQASESEIRKLQEVLQAICLHNPSLGYCQGMNFLVGMCLLFMEPEDAFWCLVGITERYFTAHYFDHSLVGAQADQEVLKTLLRDKLPRLHRHLAQLDIELCTVTLNWFLAIFFDSVPFETLLRIWDCFLLEGPKVLFRFSLAILKMHEEVLLTKQDTVSIMRQLKAIARLCYDVDMLIKVAFEDLEPFPRRQDIAAKQACFQKILREQSKKRELEKHSVLSRDNTVATDGSCYGDNALIIECAAACDSETIWVCHASSNLTRLSRVNCEDSVMYRLKIEIEARVICMHALGNDVMLLGTLSHFVHAYSTRTREMKWEAQLNESVLSLCSYDEDDQCQVFAGLADGTMAVIENFSVHADKPDVLYIHIGSSPVTCLKLVDKRLWCATGNRIIILSARTLDTVDQFQVSPSSLDYISLLQPCSGVDPATDHCVWLALRGSSVLQLWDAQALTCKMLYDVRDDRYPRSPRQQEEDNELNPARVTALLSLPGSVLVGTAQGFLIIYHLLPRCLASTDCRTDSSTEVSSVAKFVPAPSPTMDDRSIGQESEAKARNDSSYATSTPKNVTKPAGGSLTAYKSDDCVNDTSGSQHSFRTVISKSTSCLSSSPRNTSEEESSPTSKRRSATKLKGVKEVDDATQEEATVDVSEGILGDHRDKQATRDSRGNMCNSCVPPTAFAKEMKSSVDSHLNEVKKRNECLDESQLCLESSSGRKVCRRIMDPSEISICPVAEVCKEDSRKWSLRTADSCVSMIELAAPLRKQSSWSSTNTTLSHMLKRHNASVDCLPAWLSRDTLSSSLTSDSYDFDDFFVQYADDGTPSLAGHDSQVIPASACFASEEAQRLLERLTVPTVYLTMGSQEERSSTGSFWTENDDGAETSTTHEATTSEWPEGPSYDGNQPSSDLGSNISFSSMDPQYAYEVLVQERIKISDKAIRCLVELRRKGGSIVISGAGCYGDDESVLKWTEEGEEKLWTNDPVIEVCPYTNTIKPSPYTRSRLPRKVSVAQTNGQARTVDGAAVGVAGGPCGGGLMQRSRPLLEAPKATSSMGARLARMQSMFVKSTEKG
ncbi:uncharacterized protein LOC119187687 isoform X3 [Rhipicephalus microplus]|uniref:uncharacterized protein LOC119187687 isoform X3 n=1 Tax=Rhipicephalus microplus TaxID=6941 RepID=UPI003F6C54AA